jgi:very-short-patch-repair endonuclease
LNKCQLSYLLLHCCKTRATSIGLHEDFYSLNSYGSLWPEPRYPRPVLKGGNQVRSRIPAQRPGDLSGTRIGLSRLERYLPYYLDCIREDERESARFFLSDEGKRFVVLALQREWTLEEQGVLSFRAEGNEAAFAQSLRTQPVSGALFYGYPLLVDWIEKSRKGWCGGFAVPVFLLPVEYDQSGAEVQFRLIDDWPRVNNEFLKSVFSTAEERKNFLSDVGLLDVEGDPPQGVLRSFTDRLRELNLAPELEPLDPRALGTTPEVSAIIQEGFYNRALVFLGERSRFTAGLEHELEALRNTSVTTNVMASSLRLFFGDSQASPDALSASVNATHGLVEVVGLNEEQRAAVGSAFEKPLTVVTGPPGTGKSQVVVSVLANAYIRGERVLFTSRNHKAVDVVETRINAFSVHPLVIRVGGKSAERDLRSELVRFLAQLLSVSTTDEDRRAHSEAITTLNSLGELRKALWSKVEQVRQARNVVDNLDHELDGPRDRMDKGLFERLFKCDLSLPSNDPGIPLHIVLRHSAPPKGFFESIRRKLRRGRDASAVLRDMSVFRGHVDLYGELPRELTGKGDWEFWVDPLKRLIERVGVIKKAREYRKALTYLKQLPTIESFAEDLAELEEKLWDWGSRLIAAYGRLLPDRLDSTTRRALGEFRATYERLAEDQIGGRAYAQLRREQEGLFKFIVRVLPVWCVTNLSARGTLPFDPGLFDLVIIDEASQCDIPSAIPLFYRAKRAMIIGDPQQLRHISSMERHRAQLLESRHGLTSASDQPYTYVNNSIFDLAATCAGDVKVITLREHFRSHADIVEFSNRTWYRNTLRVSTDYRRLRTLPRGEPGVQWTQVAGRVQRPTGGGAICMEEAKAVVDEVEDLVVRRKFLGTVGIVTPFRVQANRIRDLVNERLDLASVERSNLIVDTAHGFQGDERDVILFSPCVGKDLPRGPKYFLSSTGNLFNVAVTRARVLLHVFGDMGACASCAIPHIEAFAAHVASHGQDGRPADHAPKLWSDPRVGHWEKPFYDGLVKAGLKPMSQYKVHQYWLDLAIVQNGLHLDVEIDGEHFHRDWDGSQCRQDLIRDLRLQALGWKVKRFCVYRIRDDRGACIREVIEACS